MSVYLCQILQGMRGNGSGWITFRNEIAESAPIFLCGQSTEKLMAQLADVELQGNANKLSWLRYLPFVFFNL